MLASTQKAFSNRAREPIAGPEPAIFEWSGQLGHFFCLRYIDGKYIFCSYKNNNTRMILGVKIYQIKMNAGGD